MRAIAEKTAGYPCTKRPSHRGLCFVPHTGDYAGLKGSLAVRTRPRPGQRRDRRRRPAPVLGAHPSGHHFTVGQRKGLGLAAANPLYVLPQVDARENRVVVGPRAALATDAVAVRGARLHRAGAEVDAVKLRYRSRPVACRVAGDLDRRAPTAGSSSSSPTRSTAPRPARPPACSAATSSSGTGRSADRLTLRAGEVAGSVDLLRQGRVAG